jgi:small conductance mechanosensitive channel
MPPPRPPPEAPRRFSTRVLAYSVGVLALFVGIGVALFYFLEQFTSLPFSASTLLRLVVVAAVGLAIIWAINALLKGVVGRAWGERRAGLASALFRMVGYVALTAALLIVAGVSGLSLLAGGTFAGLVIGLAGQQVLSNLFAGFEILVAEPYQIGERVTITTWQFGLDVPAYPPKFYSQDYLIPGYTGIVRDVGIFYTTFESDEGTTIRMPNSILVQAAVISHDVVARPVRTKYEVPATLDPQEVINAIETAVRGNEWVARPDSVKAMINQATSSVYLVTIDAVCQGAFEEPARSSILITVVHAVRKLSASRSVPSPG